ncbi:MAG: energy-coupling factor ABC transporter permease [Marinomonas colpomeniae]
MHIEPGLVDGAKIVLSYATALGALGLSAKASIDLIKKDGLLSLIGRSSLATLLVFIFFQVMPHHSAGVSEVHFILGSTLFLMFGPAAASIGLLSGLLMQGVLFEPIDLPQYGMNVTTLLLPLFAMSALSRRIIAENTAYVDITYQQALKLSLTYQGGIITWVAFWVFYGQGFGAENMSSIATFGFAYLSVVLIEPVLDLAVLAGAKSLSRFKHSSLLETRLFS